jgi:trk system potassium uptake protein TrkA
MHAVIVGAGTVGSRLAWLLLSNGHEIAVVERDRERCKRLEETLGSVAVPGNGTSAVVLTEAGITRADLVVATTSNDDVNLVICRLAKIRFNVPRATSLVNDPDLCDLFGLAGVDTVVDATDLLVEDLHKSALPQGFVRLLPVPGAGARSLLKFTVPANSPAAEKRLRELAVPSSVVVSLVVSLDGEAVVPTGDTTIRAGDEVIAVATDEDREALSRLLLRVDE